MNNEISLAQSSFRFKTLSLTQKIAFAFGMACLTGILAQIRFYVPFSPVPVTGQVLGVLLSGAICGSIYGSLSQLIYVVLGLSGIGWFTFANTSWFSLLTAPTAGYLLGFVIAPLIIGKSIETNNPISKIKYMILGMGIIYLFGALVLKTVLNISLLNTIAIGVIPFIGVDLLKASVATGINILISRQLTR
jgi:biotin transport system substrate-specific component